MKKLSTSIEAISQRNKKNAIKYFESIGALPKNRAKNEYVLHHKDPNLLYQNLQRYIEWNIEDLTVITRSEHSKLHQKGNSYHTGKLHSEKSKRLISQNRKGKCIGNKIGKGRIHMTNGLVNKMIKPEEYEEYVKLGFTNGRVIIKNKH